MEPNNLIKEWFANTTKKHLIFIFYQKEINKKKMMILWTVQVHKWCYPPNKNKQKHQTGKIKDTYLHVPTYFTDQTSG